MARDNMPRRTVHPKIAAWMVLLAAALTCGVVLVIVLRHHQRHGMTPIIVELQEITRIHSEPELQGTYWVQIKDERGAASLARRQNIVLPSNDYSRHYLLVSEGRAVRRLTYTRADEGWGCLSEGEYLGHVTLGRELTAHTIYVYAMDCTRVCNGAQAGAEDTIPPDIEP